MAEPITMNSVFSQIHKLMARHPEEFNRQLVFCLFNIRFLSDLYHPSYYQLTLNDYKSSYTFGQEELSAWDVIVRYHGDNYNAAVQTAISLLEREHPQLQGALYFPPDTAIPPSEAVGQLLSLLSHFVLPDEASQNPAQAYEALLNHFAIHDDSEHNNFHTPRDVAGCLIHLLGPLKGSLYTPSCGSGSLFFNLESGDLESGQLSIYAQAADTLSYSACRLNSFFRSLPVQLDKEKISALSCDRYPKRQFDFVLANPPFNQSHWGNEGYSEQDSRWSYGIPPKNNANFAWLEHILHHLNASGRAAVLLPNGSLSSHVRGEQVIRKNLVKAGLVEAIITLPGGLFFHTKIPCCIWVLAKKRCRHQETLFINAEQLGRKISAQGKKTRMLDAQALQELSALLFQFRSGGLQGKTELYAVASWQEMAHHAFILSPNQYTVSQKESSIQPERDDLLPLELANSLQELLDREEALNQQLKRYLEGMGIAIC